jgi:hypothetical protein
VKLDSLGSILWQKCVGGSYSDFISYFQETIDGYVVSGSTSSNDGDVSGNHTTSGLYYDQWLAKFDGTGILQWQKCLGGSRTEGGLIKSASDGGYIIAGATYSNDGDVSGNHDATGTYPDCWIVKLDSLANITWQRALGGGLIDGASDILQETDEGFVFTGVCRVK